MFNNRLEDFLRTGEAEQPSITCPACGSVMGLTVNGSYQMVLTENARQQVVRLIHSYRSAIKNVESVLARRNAYAIHRVEFSAYPHGKEEDVLYPKLNTKGEYETLGAKAVDEFASNLDRLNWFKKLYDLSVHSASIHHRTNNDPNLQKKEAEKTRDILLAGFEPGSITGPLMDLIFSQRSVEAWTKKMLASPDRGIASAELKQVVKEVSPNISQYLDDLVAFEEAKSTTGGNNAIPRSDQSIREAVLRCQYIVALLLGHEAKISTQKSNFFVKPGIPYSLPRLTVVSPPIFCSLLKSEVIIGSNQLKWSPELKSAVRTELANSAVQRDDRQITARIVELLGTEISVLVSFICTGPSGYTNGIETPEAATNIRPGNDRPGNHSLDDLEGEEQTAICSWYPKPQPTHPVVLIGSPGTGKSAVMLTGLTTLYRESAAIGANIAFDSPTDESRMKEYDARYWIGAKPKPTPVHERLSVKLSVLTSSKPLSPINYVFTDVPGQVATRCLTEEGPDPVVLNILNNAETIVFFFDLSIENTIREKLTQGDRNNAWSHVTNNFERVKKERPPQSTGSGSGKLDQSASEAMVSQLQLLQKLLNDLRLTRTDAELKQVNFICVIPKADLFVQDGQPDKQGNPAQYFLTPFYEFLSNEDILVRSRQRDGESFIGKNSLAGSGSKLMMGDQTSEILRSALSGNGTSVNGTQEMDRISTQYILLRGISNNALACLENIGHAIEDDSDLRPLRQSLDDTIQVRLIDMLHNIFGEQNVYFLPVSALGEERGDISEHKNNVKSPTTAETKVAETRNPFNQKLSEYIFALPIILASIKDRQK